MLRNTVCKTKMAAARRAAFVRAAAAPVLRPLASVPRAPANVAAVATPKAPAAIGPYSQAVTANGFVFVSGCLGLDAETGAFVSDTEVAAQAERALENMAHVLDAAGSHMGAVVKTTVLLADMADYASVNEVYARHFGEPAPARSAFAVRTLPKEALVEIECVAVVPE